MYNSVIVEQFELTSEAFKWFSCFDNYNQRLTSKIEPDIFYDMMCRVASVYTYAFVFRLLLRTSAWEWKVIGKS